MTDKSWAETSEDDWPEGKAGRCDESRMQDLRPFIPTDPTNKENALKYECWIRLTQCLNFGFIKAFE